MSKMKTALVVIDLQKGITRLNTVHPITPIIQNVRNLAQIFRLHQLPVVVIKVLPRSANLSTLPPDYAELEKDIEIQPTDLQITKQTWSAFTNTGLHQKLQSLHVDEILLTGVATSRGVESTARAASELGYHLCFVSDAITDLVQEPHVNSFKHIFPLLGRVATTQDLLKQYGQ